jgi:hypothetical protein
VLRTLKLGRRTARKKKTMGHHPDRNAQFENITRLRHEYEASGDAVISIDTKTKELLGNFHRAGTTFTAETVETFAADFKHNMKIVFDDYLPKWNYRAVPESVPDST